MDIKKQIKDSGLVYSKHSPTPAYDYRQVFYRWPRFCAWRNEKLSKKKYQFAEELIDKKGDLLIRSEELELYLKEDEKNILPSKANADV